MLRATRWAALLVGLALLATAGCGTDSPAPDQLGRSGPAQSTSAGSTSDQSTSGQSNSGQSTSGGSGGSTGPAADAVLVDFGRQGGVAGLSDQLAVREDGGYTLTRVKPAVERSGKLTPAELADLRAKLASSGFAKLPHVQPGGGTDMFTYHLTYQGTEILAQQAGLADSLRPVVDALSTIIDSGGS